MHLKNNNRAKFVKVSILLEIIIAFTKNTANSWPKSPGVWGDFGHSREIKIKSIFSVASQLACLMKYYLFTMFFFTYFNGKCSYFIILLKHFRRVNKINNIKTFTTPIYRVYKKSLLIIKNKK